MKRKCIDCGTEFERHTPSLRCFPCNNARTAVARLANAHLRSAIKAGRVRRQLFCDICGAKAEAHHDDYGRPAWVRWLCRSHHHLAHAQEDKVYKPPKRIRIPNEKRRQAGLKSWQTRRTRRMVQQPDGLFKYEKIK